MARANCLALESDYTGVLNVATGVAENLLKLIQCIETAGGAPAQVFKTAARAGDIRESIAATDKAEKHLSFRYQVPLQEGIRQLMATAKVKV